MRHLLFALVATALLSTGGCYYDNEETLYPNSFCDTANVTYSGTIEPLVQSKCATPGCHVPGGDGAGDFTTYAGLVSQIVNDGPLLASIRWSPGATVMPASGKLPSCDIKKFEIWIAAGYPNN
ncbi:MAG TPA: hypothetical protein VKG92_10265 [Flavobacteriales bacterium]|nr:hypothetical protein [Flavobacteriales bacterium]